MGFVLSSTFVRWLFRFFRHGCLVVLPSFLASRFSGCGLLFSFGFVSVCLGVSLFSTRLPVVRGQIRIL